MAKTRAPRCALTEREQFWLGHLRRIERTGVETKAYGREHGLSVGALYQARKQLVRLGAWPERGAVVAPPVFTPLRIVDTPAVDAACRLRLADGTVLEWSTAPAPAELASLLASAR